VLLLIVLAAVFAGYILGSYLLYLLAALVIATLLTPVAEGISRLRFLGVGLPKVLTILTAYLLFIAFISVILLVFVPLISHQIERIGQADFEELAVALEEPLYNIETWLQRHRLTARPHGFLLDDATKALESLIGSIEVGNVFNQAVSITGSVLVALLSVSFISFFLLYEQNLLKNLILRWTPNAYFEVVAAAVYKIERLLGSYLRGLLLEVFFVFAMVALGLNIIGIEYAFTLATFAGIANLIPYLGPLIGTLFGVAVSLANAPAEVMLFEEYMRYGLQVAGVFLFAQLIDNVVLQPLIYARSVKAHPLEIFTMIFAGGSIAGIGGMMLAIPAYTVLRVTFLELRRGIREFKVFKSTFQINQSHTT
jgi:predicted PurR-regulated permease PerM